MKRNRGKYGWLSALILFSAGLYMVASIHKIKSRTLHKSRLIELSDSAFYRKLYTSDRIFCIFFYQQESPECIEMENTINNIKNKGVRQLSIYKLNAEKYPSVFYDLNLSALPVMILFYKGKEKKRIMGLVSTYSMEFILKRDTQ